MAQGRSDQVPEPFANRILYPLVVKQVAAVTRGPIERAFILTTVAALLALALTLVRTLV
jgi:hypothetical protein